MNIFRLSQTSTLVQHSSFESPSSAEDPGVIGFLVGSVSQELWQFQIDKFLLILPYLIKMLP